MEGTNDTTDYYYNSDNSTDDHDDGQPGNRRSGKGNGNRTHGANLRDDVTGNVAQLLFGSAIVTVGSRGIVAQIASLEIVSGIDSNIELDASASADLDNNNQLGPLQVINVSIQSEN